MSSPFSEHAERLIFFETVFNFYALVYAGDCSEVSVVLSHSMQKDWFWMRWSSISMHSLMPETARKYQLSFLIECRKIDIGWDVFQFLCISLCRSQLKCMRYAFSQHAERVMSAKAVFDFYALAYARFILPQSMQKGWISWDGLQPLCISLCQRLLKSMSYPFSEHAERLILGETVFNFYALAYAGDCSNVRVVLSQGIQKGWY